MNKILHIGSTFKSTKDDDGTLRITGFASTNDTDRAGDVILSEAWTKGGLENFKKNPVILFNHDYNKPIGKATGVSVTEQGLGLEAKISKAAGEIKELIEDGVLGAFSVGFRIKDADYNKATDGFIIKDAELFEVSVVSVPCNQAAIFSVAKSFESDVEYKEYLKTFISTDPAEQSAESTANAQNSAGQADGNMPHKEKSMTPEEIQAMMKQVAEETAKTIAADQAKAAKEAKEAADRLAAEEAAFTARLTTGAERLMADVEKRFAEKNESLESIVNELKSELKEKSTEIERMRESKRQFTDRGTSSDWKKEFEGEIVDKFVLGLATGKRWSTKAAKDLVEKVNAHSAIQVSSEDFEQIVSTTIERDVQNALILAPLFREIQMNAASMILPILPDAGYAEFVSAQMTSNTSNPDGNLYTRGGSTSGFSGIDLQQRILTTSKLVSISYLGNETEEDAILPILPLLRESIVRSHARAVEAALLTGGSADAQIPNSFDGLLEHAKDAGSVYQVAASGYSASDKITAADLLQMRILMGKYGLRPDDLVYIISQDAYYNLLEDAEFQNLNEVGALATKIKGSIGQVYGSNVIICDEFAAKAAGKFAACAVNTRNYLIPRLRGFTLESDYEVTAQRRVLVATQRLGFADIIANAKTVAAMKYKGA